MTYIKWGGIVGIYSTGKKRVNNAPEWPLETWTKKNLKVVLPFYKCNTTKLNICVEYPAVKVFFASDKIFRNELKKFNEHSSFYDSTIFYGDRKKRNLILLHRKGELCPRHDISPFIIITFDMFLKQKTHKSQDSN